MRTILQSHKPAFTMLELVFVITILGILVSYAMPRMNRDLRQEAADAILSDIRFTQHLAVNDNKHDMNTTRNWQSSFWNITFRQCSSGGGWYQTIYSDLDKKGNADANEIAIDPSNGMHMGLAGTDCTSRANISPKIFLTEKYAISKIVLTSSCGGDNSKYIGFDYLGRPHNGFLKSTTADYSSYRNTDCTFTFNSPEFDTPLTIQINKETGYAFIVGQPDS